MVAVFGSATGNPVVGFGKPEHLTRGGEGNTLGWLTLFVILGSGVCGGILFLLRRGPDPAIQARFDAWRR